MKRKALLTVSPLYSRSVDLLKPGLEQAGYDVHFLNRHDEKLEPKELIELLRGAEIYVVSNARIPREVIEGSPDLALIAKHGVGVDNIDLAAATECGVLVTNAPGANAISVAEMVFASMLCLARQIREIERGVHEGVWRAVMGRELHGRTLGIIGLGNIGKRVALRARAFGMRVFAYDVLDYSEFCQEHEVEAVSLDKLIAESDVVTIHVPLTPVTRHMIGAPQLARMRSGSILVHTARGGVVDEDALYEALASRHLSGAAIDVFECEPLGASRLKSLDNILLTSHIAGLTEEAVERVGRQTLDNVLAYHAGRTPRDLVNPEAAKASRHSPSFT